MKFMNKYSASFFLTIICSHSSSVLSDIKLSIDAETNLKGWKFNQGDMELELLQRTPDQTRGFFLARGFSTIVANDIATSCVFQTIVRNKGSETRGKPIVVSLKKWKILKNSKSLPLKLKEDWNQEWADTRVKPSAQLAFRWATFPTDQTFNPAGDYNWGMISFGLQPGESFDLNIHWNVAEKSNQAIIKKMQCPEDK